MRKRYLLLPVIAVLIGASSCTSTNVETFYRPSYAVADKAFVKPGVDFSIYTKLQAMPLEIWYAQNEQGGNPEDLERIRGYFRNAFIAAIGDDYEVVSEPGSDVLKVVASLVDFKVNPGTPADLSVSSRLRSVVAAGRLTFVVEVMDSQTGEVLGRAADQEKTVIEEEYGKPATEWDEVEAAAGRWAGMFRRWLDLNLGADP